MATKEWMEREIKRLNAVISARDVRIKALNDKDVRIRREFVSAYNWGHHRAGMLITGRLGDLEVPSWDKIFVELGKILERRDDAGMRDTVNQLDSRVQNLEEEVYKEKE